MRGSNPGGSEIFRTRPDRPWGSFSLLHNRYRVCFPRIKRPGDGVNHLPLSSSEANEIVELYIYSLSGPSWPVIGRNLPLSCVPTVLQCATHNIQFLNTKFNPHIFTVSQNTTRRQITKQCIAKRQQFFVSFLQYRTTNYYTLIQGRRMGGKMGCKMNSLNEENQCLRLTHFKLWKQIKRNSDNDCDRSSHVL